MSSDPTYASSLCLEEIPAPSFRVLLQHLSTHDLARLRQVSSAVCEHTSKHIPGITLRLCVNSDAHQLQQWQQAIRQLQYAPRIKVLVEGMISAAVFEAAMQMLSQHTSATTLHLQGVNDANWFRSNQHKRQDYCRPFLEALIPVKYMLNRLECLIIDGIMFQQLARDLKQLTAAAATNRGYQQLQLLKLDAVWNYTGWSTIRWDPRVHWSTCAGALMQLAQAFPMLTEMHIKLPGLNLDSKPSFLDFGPVEQFAGAKPPATWLVPALTNRFAVADLGSEPESAAALDPRIRRQLAAVAVVIAVANAALQWQHLQQLTVTEVPDIWCPGEGWNGAMYPSAAATAAATTQAAHAVFADPVFSSMRLQSSPATAELFSTMDGCGSWLLQHHKQLHYLMFSTSELADVCRTNMIWQQQQQVRCHSSGSSGTAVPGPDGIASCLCDIKLLHKAQGSRDAAADSVTSSNQASTISSTTQPPLMGLLARLSPYSSRPAPALLSCIYDLSLEVSPHHIAELSGLLAEVKSMKHLQVKVECEHNVIYQHTLGTTVAAAATVQGLRSLEVQAWWGLHALPVNLLLPLTAAAGGPGSGLTKLLLGATFSEGQVQAATAAAAAAVAAAEAGNDGDMTSDSTNQHHQGAHELTKTLGALSTNAPVTAAQAPAIDQVQGSTAWHDALQQLTGLRELSINQSGMRPQLLELPWESLPASLEVLECVNLNIFSATTAAEQSYTSSSKTSAGTVDWQPENCESDVAPTSTSSPPRLQKLTLIGCSVSRSSIFASRLQELTVISSTGTTSLASAAAVCPTVGTVTWRYHIDDDGQEMGLDLLVAATNSQQSATASTGPGSMVQNKAAGWSQPVESGHPAVLQLQSLNTRFKDLRTLTLTGFPCKLTAEDIQPALYGIQGMTCMRICINSRDCDNGDCIALQNWLQQQLPWATVLVASGY